MVVLVCLHITLPHYHQYADLSESIELPKCLSGIFCLERMSKIKSVIAIIFHATYGAVCIQLNHFPYANFESEAWPIYHCLGFGHETMVCAVCFFLYSFFNMITVRDQFIELTQNNSNLSKWYLSYTMLNILQLLSMETIAVDFQMNMSTWQLVVVIWPASLH